MHSRNPYLLLGVEYGAPPDVARRCFARAARRLRRAGSSEVTIEDLNWALNEIHSQRSDPFDSVTVFRVPANPQAFMPAVDGMFAPPPVPLARRTTTTESDRELVLARLATDISVLLDAVRPTTARFDYGYQTKDGTAI